MLVLTFGAGYMMLSLFVLFYTKLQNKVINYSTSNGVNSFQNRMEWTLYKVQRRYPKRMYCAVPYVQFLRSAFFCF